MTWTAEQIRDEFADLHSVRGRLSAALFDSATRLVAQGELPELTLIDELTRYRSRLGALAAAAQLPSSRGVVPEAATDRTVPAGDVRRSLIELEQAFETQADRQATDAVLTAVQQLQVRDCSPATADLLLPVVSQARDLQERLWTDDRWPARDVSDVLKGRHPLACVLVLADAEATLSDSEWDRCHAVVTEHFGRGLSTALARGRIQRSASVGPMTAASEPAPETPATIATVGSFDLMAPLEAAPATLATPAAPATPTIPVETAIPADTIFTAGPVLSTNAATTTDAAKTLDDGVAAVVDDGGRSVFDLVSAGETVATSAATLPTSPVDAVSRAEASVNALEDDLVFDVQAPSASLSHQLKAAAQAAAAEAAAVQAAAETARRAANAVPPGLAPAVSAAPSTLPAIVAPVLESAAAAVTPSAQDVLGIEASIFAAPASSPSVSANVSATISGAVPPASSPRLLTAATSGPATTSRSLASNATATITDRIDPPVRQPADTLLARLAREAQAKEGPGRAARLQDALWQLIREQRMDIAAVWAQCLAARGGVYLPSVPAPLLRALALSDALAYSKGDVAQQLEQELRSLGSHETRAHRHADSFGVGCLLRAAALMPALLGAAPAAAQLLRSFEIEPGESHLYNYCTRVVTFGERLQGQAAELFQAQPKPADWLAEREQLVRDADRWLNESVGRAMTYSRSSPLFQHPHWTVLAGAAQRRPDALQNWAIWQEVLTMTHRLVRPIRSRASSERHTVKQEVTRLITWLREELPTGDAANRPHAIKPHHLWTPAMRALVLEAVDLANRWLRLESAAAPASAAGMASRGADDLRAELLERTPSVLAELKALGETYQAAARPITAVGLVTLKRIIERIQQLCSGQRALGLHEPDPKAVLAAELLKVPGLELSSDWQVKGEPAAIEAQLLDWLSRGPHDWRSAFSLQCLQADHAATARLLELPVWPDDATVQDLRARRTRLLDACRQTAARELDDFASELSLDVHDYPHLAEERRAVDLRLDQLRAALPYVLRFGPVQAQLDRLRDWWQKLLRGDIQPLAARHGHATEGVALNDSGILRAAAAAGLAMVPQAPPSTPAQSIFGGE